MPASDFEVPDEPRQPSVGLILTAIEQIRSALGASCAILGVRGTAGLRYVACAGTVPAGVAEFQLDSEFTRECMDTGGVTLCDDAREDARIRPEVAELLHVRSAIAVPVHFRNSILGVIELFSSMPSVFHGAHVAALQEIGELLAPVLASESVRAVNSGADEPPASFARAPFRGTHAAPVVVNDDEAEDVPEPAEALGDHEEGVRAREPEPVPVELPELFEPSLPKRGIVFAPRESLLRTTPGRTLILGVATAGLVALLYLVTHAGPLITRPGGNNGASAPVVRSSSRVPNTSIRTESVSLTDKQNQPATLTQATFGARGGADELKAAPTPVPSPVTSSLAAKNDESAETLEARSPKSTSEKIRDTAQPTLVRTDASLPLPAMTKLTAATLVPTIKNEEPRRTTTTTIPAPIVTRSTSTAPPHFVLDHTLQGHSGWVTGLAFTPDGRRLVSGSWDQTVKMWDVSTGLPAGMVSNNIQYVQALASSRDGRWIAAENSADSVTIWDTGTGQPVHTLLTDRKIRGAGNNWVYSIAFSPDGRLLASGLDDKTIRIWDVKSGQPLHDFTANKRSVIYVAFSPDGRWLATGGNDKTILIWDVESGKLVRKLTGHKKTVYAVAFSPTGQWLASASGDKTVKIWDLDTEQEVHTLTGHDGLVTTLAFSPDGRWLASGSWDRTIKIWDAESGRELETLASHSRSIYSIAFGPGGNWIASGSEDGSINLWRGKFAGSSRN
ncbi:MAG TPA: GAF domain-containing protein [Candidatus Acidoferrum sp.]